MPTHKQIAREVLNEKYTVGQKSTTFYAELRDLLIAKNKIAKQLAALKQSDETVDERSRLGTESSAIEASLDSIYNEITQKVLELNRAKDLVDGVLLREGVVNLNDDEDQYLLTALFITTLNKEATMSKVRRHANAFLATGIASLVVPFAATVGGMLIFDLVIGGGLAGLATGSLAMGTSLAAVTSALPFLAFAGAFGPVIGTLIVAAIITAAAFALYGIVTGAVAAATTNSVVPTSNDRGVRTAKEEQLEQEQARFSATVNSALGATATVSGAPGAINATKVPVTPYMGGAIGGSVHPRASTPPRVPTPPAPAA